MRPRCATPLQAFPSADPALATASGGTLGYGIFANAGPKLAFPARNPNVPREEAKWQGERVSGAGLEDF